MSQLGAMVTGVPLTLTFDLGFFKVKMYLENGRPDCHGTKRTGVDRLSRNLLITMCDTILVQ